MAGDLKYSVEFDTQPAQRALRSLQDQVASFGSAIASAFAFKELTQISSSFEDLRTSLQLLYRDTKTGANAFDDIKKFAATSVFSVEDLTKTVIKLKAAGLEPTVALLRMFADTSSVAADSVGALQAITDLYARTTAGGLGLEDLNRLADRGIPVFDILSKRLGISRLEISKIGQTAEGSRVILRALEDGLTQAFGGASEARAKNLSQAWSNFKDTLANTADAIGQAGLNQALSSILRGLGSIIIAIEPLFTLLAKFINLIVQTVAALKPLADAFSPVIDAFKAFIGLLGIAAIAGFIRGLIGIAVATRGVTVAMAALNAVMSAGPLRLFAIGAALGVGFISLLEKLGGTAKEVADGDGFKVFKDGQLGAGTEDLKEKVKALNQELNKFKVEMQSVVDSFARYNLNAREALGLDSELLSVSRETAAIRRNEADINKRLADEIVKLKEQKAKLTEEERNQGRAGIIDATIKKLEAQAEADKKAGAAAISSSEAAQRADSLRLFGIKSQEEVNKNIRKIQDDINKSVMPEMQKREYDILSAARERAQAEIEAEQAKRNSLLTDAEKQAYLDRALAGTQELIKKERESYNTSRQFSTGWKQAFNEYIENATNNAEHAKRIFQSMTTAMEDLLMNFFKTGKFGWRDFVQTIIDTLMKSQIQQLVGKIMAPTVGGAGGGGGLLGGSIIPGILAEGGPAAMNRPYIVGERGPELFVPASNGTMIPNSGLGGSANVTYNISAVDAQSFRQMLARDPSFLYAVTEQGRRTLPGAA